MVANQRFAPRFGSSTLACSQIRDLLPVSLRSLVHKLSVCSPFRFAHLFTNFQFALRFASLTCSRTFSLLSVSLRSLACRFFFHCTDSFTKSTWNISSFYGLPVKILSFQGYTFGDYFFPRVYGSERGCAHFPGEHDFVPLKGDNELV